MSKPGYTLHKSHQQHVGHTLTHHDGHQASIVATIEPVTHRIPSLTGTKRRTKYVVKNQLGASEEHFSTQDGAVQHAIQVHKKQPMVGHPLHAIGEALAAVTQAIQTAAKDPRMNNHEDQHRLLQISKAHAVAVQTHKLHTKT